MPLELLLKFKTPIICLFVSALLLGTGYYYGSKQSKPQVKIETKEVIVEKVVEKKVFVEVKKKDEKENTHTVITKHPDGTEVTVIDTKKESTETASTKEETSKETDKLAVKESTSTPIGKTYRIAAYAIEKLPKLSKLNELEKPDYQMMVGRRVLGDLWLETGYQFKNNAIALGLSWEF